MQNNIQDAVGIIKKYGLNKSIIAAELGISKGHLNNCLKENTTSYTGYKAGLSPIHQNLLLRYLKQLKLDIEAL